MSKQRKDDFGCPNHFRSERVFQSMGQWYFQTREGTTEGPFSDRRRAEVALECFVRTMSSPFAPPANLTMAPALEGQKRH